MLYSVLYSSLLYSMLYSMLYNGIVLSFIVCCRYVGQVISSQTVESPDKEAIKLESKIELRNTLSSFYFS